MITGVQFGFAPPELIKRVASVTVKESVLYEKKQPRKQALHDPHFGPIDRGTLCSDCGLPMEDCPGHGGVIPSAGVPFINPWVAEIALATLKSVCYYDSKLLIPRDSLRCEYIINNYQGTARMRELSKATAEMKYCGAPPKELKLLKGLGLLDKKKRRGSRRGGCGREQPVYSKLGGIAIGATFYLDCEVDKQAPRFNPTIVYRILSNISKEDAIALGFQPNVSPVEALMAWDIYVPTTHIRFPVSHDFSSTNSKGGGSGGRGGEDDITVKYNNILKVRNKLAALMKKEPTPLRSYHVKYIWSTASNRLIECQCDQPGPTCPCITNNKNGEAKKMMTVEEKKEKDAASKKREKKDKTVVDYWNELQTELVALVTGEYRRIDSSSQSAAAAAARSSRAQKQSYGQRGIKARIIGKGGRVRGNLGGKRQDFSARTVISGSQDIDIDEIGVPDHFRSILTKEEIVTRYNHAYLTDLLRLQQVSRIRSADGSKEWNAEYLNTNAFRLEMGMKVDRWLQNGDYVQIGRQPSLHRPSTMVHRVKLLPPGVFTFLLNLAVTTPYNADFDGDEMYLVVLQSYAEVMEARMLMHVPMQILSPQNSRALIGFVQHSVLSAYALGFRNVLLTRERFCQYAGRAYRSDTLPAVHSGGSFYTGKQLFSLFLPPSLQFESSSGHKKIIIRNGQWLSGYWTKSALLQLVYLLFRDFGCIYTSRFISDVQRMLKLFLDDYGATLGPADLRNPCTETTNAIVQKLQQVLDPANPTEAQAMEHTKNAKEFVTEHLLKNLRGDRSSRLLHIIRSGTKGSNTNLLQLMACLGETILLGKRIVFPTSHWTRGVNSLAARGFIGSCFATGLNPYESYCHFASGREGIVDTGNKTGRVGYLQRKLARMQGDLRVETDGTVRDAEGRIVMERYGDDGFTPSHVERYTLRMASIRTVKELEDVYKSENAREWHLYILPLYNLLQQQNPRVSVVTTPLPFTRLWRLSGMQQPSSSSSSSMNREELFQRLENLFHRLRILCNHPLFHIAFWDAFAVRKWPRMPTGEEWQRFENFILHRYMLQAMSRGGDMVGAIAAQSIAEPAMQMTLRTFYLPGVSSMLLQSGFEALNDICNATQGSAPPTMTVFLKPEYQAQVHDICKTIPGKFLPQLCKSITVRCNTGSTTPSNRCPCMDLTRSVLSNCPGAIRAAPFYMELELVSEGDVKRVMEVLGRFFTPLTAINLLHCGPWIRVYFDCFHPMLDKKDVHVRFTFDLLMKQMKENVCVYGCNRIKAAHVQSKDGSIVLLGSHTEAIWNLKEVDMTKTMTSDIREIESMFGIDAAALVLEDKLITCMKSQGIPLDERHAKLVAANMTRSGRIVPNTGLGVSTESQSTLRKSTFEKMSAHLASEAARGAFDPCLGTVEALIMSSLPRMGSNYCKIVPHPPLPGLAPSAAPRSKGQIPVGYADLAQPQRIHCKIDYGWLKRMVPGLEVVASNYVPENWTFTSLQPNMPSSSTDTSSSSYTMPFIMDRIPIWISAL